MATADNLKAAFAGESQANRKYLAFGHKADADGYNGIAKLFRAAAQAETIHALRELNDLGGVKSTAENRFRCGASSGRTRFDRRRASPAVRS